MILTQIKLTDFGLYQGEQKIVLTPKKNRNIILFGGKNGAGKSTLLEAIRLCFYGQTAYDNLSSRPKYEEYLGSKIHTNPGALIQPSFSLIAVDFQFADSDGLHDYSITRSWERNSTGRVSEIFNVERDGKELSEVSADHWQEFVRDLFPPGVSQLFFFDGEKIQQLAEDSSDQDTLSEAVKSLLGVDMIERLSADLSIYRSRINKPIVVAGVQEKLNAINQKLQELDDSITQRLQEKEALKSNIEDLRIKIRSLEGKILSEGGTFARNREMLLQQDASIKVQIQQSEEIIRESALGLLPFTLCPKLAREVKQQILAEEAAARGDAAAEILSSIKEQLICRITELDALRVSGNATLREEVVAIVEDAMRPVTKNDGFLVHGLSADVARQLVRWIDIASTETSQKVIPIAGKLEDLYRKQQRTQLELNKIPAEEIIRPLMVGLNALNQAYGKAISDLAQIASIISELESDREDQRRAYSKIAKDQDDQNLERDKAERALKIQAVLDEYKLKLIEKRIADLQRYLTECFNLLSRKKDSVRRIEISPKDFSVTLRDRKDRKIPKSQLSAGEKQIYAISVLWALAKTSGRPLPMIVDTPLARLDSDHRLSLARNYFPKASHQTLILSTDTEIDQTYFAELRPHLSRSYQLDFVPEEGGTFVRDGYFWSSPHETD
jgi:DNA sulfur modification protein DndD